MAKHDPNREDESFQLNEQATSRISQRVASEAWRPCRSRQQGVDSKS
jgi:hypothetical protein